MAKFVALTATLLLIVLGCNPGKIVTPEGETVRYRCQPIYGNYCGKGYPAYHLTGYKPRPVDVWDRACMEHDFCYDEEGESGKDLCDDIFAQRLEELSIGGVPAPHEMVNAYNLFKDNKPYRQFYIDLWDILDATGLDCEGGEGEPTLFCDVGFGGYNCEISGQFGWEGAQCYCDYPQGVFDQFTGFLLVSPGRYPGFMRTADFFW